MKHRSVVANFIFRDTQDDAPLVALFRRSHHPNVHTYQGKLAPISGSIDADDADTLAAAARELNEETQLVAHRHLMLRFCGAPFSFSDEEAQRSWTVHPFGWKLTTGEDDIKLDWEHSGWQWTRPEDILSCRIAADCVPSLKESFRRVYFGHGGMFGERYNIARESTAGKAFLSGLEQLRTDRKNGARALATNALSHLSTVVKAMEPLDRTDLTIAAYHLVYSGRPSMNAAISSVVLSALHQLSLLAESTFTRSKVIGIFDRCLASREEVSRKISASFMALVSDRCQDAQRVSILTLSSSSTISHAILYLLENSPDLHLHLTVLESRPLCEGVSMAAEILKSARAISADNRLHIQLAPDSHIAQVARIPTPSFLVLGADRISPSGHVSNKTGSTAAAVVTKAVSPRTQVVVLSETDKIVKPSDFGVYVKGEENVDREMQEHSPEANDPAEVTGVWAAAGLDAASTSILIQGEGDGVPVKVQNVYFEWVPSKFIDHYICEDGALQRETIKRISMAKARLEEEIFAGLYAD